MEHLKKAAKEYYLKNKEYIDKCHKEYRQKNIEHMRCLNQEYRKKNREHYNVIQKKWRHKKEIHIRYNSKLGFCKTREYRNLQNQKRRALKKGGGELTIKTIQLVYEDNIKRYGTLTCYLCLNPVEFKNDHLEHKTPLSRGGTNEYNNLAISCAKCNKQKNTKTEKEYRLWLMKKS